MSVFLYGAEVSLALISWGVSAVWTTGTAINYLRTVGQPTETDRLRKIIEEQGDAIALLERGIDCEKSKEDESGYLVI